uniref:DUF938 domain-containing protein n=1 Tax=Ningiella ruwaisensis TaxID=2364274 RepID=UPI00109EEEF3|nr:DUF938 domain-containing protein [Ningiella ruwaisensis]
MTNQFEKPFSQACENNKTAILNVLLSAFSNSRKVLEIGSGTGQHAVHFARHLPHLMWQTADQYEYHPGIKQWINEYPSANLMPPLTLKLPETGLPDTEFDAVFSANTAHIMQRSEATWMMQAIAKRLPKNGVFCQYGPFTFDGEFTSQSNADFHAHLVQSGYGGYRDISELKSWAKPLKLDEVIDMPANNHLLVWRKS